MITRLRFFNDQKSKYEKTIAIINRMRTQKINILQIEFESRTARKCKMGLNIIL